MVSSLISPFRWYSKYFQQNRFDIDCKSVCDFKLITDRKHLIPFQFSRASSGYAIKNWILRPCCNDTNEPILNLGQSKNFNNWTNSGAWSLNQSCDTGVCADTSQGWADSNLCYNNLIPGQTYTVFIDYSKSPDVSQVPFTFLVKNGNVTLLSSTLAGGVVEITFTATSSNFCLSFLNNGINDSLCVKSVQFVKAFAIQSTDIILDKSLLNLFAAQTKDYIIYCGEELATPIPVGCYYSIIRDENNQLFFSEIITVINFEPNSSPYFILEWYNSCDFEDIFYKDNSFFCAQYKNRLYLEDAVLTRPEYPFKEEGEEDGNSNFNTTFQKLQKNVSLICYKLPEFIVDALQGIRLHDAINYWYPMRQNQLVLDNSVNIKSVETSVEYVVNDCFANVTLKMLLNELFVDETCCKEIAVKPCKDCNYLIPGACILDPSSYEFYMCDEDTIGFTLYSLVGGLPVIIGQNDINGNWVSATVLVGSIICEMDLDGNILKYYEVRTTGIFLVPIITSANIIGGGVYLFTGKILTGSYGQVEYNFGSGWQTILNQTFNSVQLNSGIMIDLGTGSTNCPFISRIKMFDLNCNYTTSATFPMIADTNINC